MSNPCYTNQNIWGTSSPYTYSTEAGAQDATVVGTQTGTNFGFKPLVAGAGMTVDETTNPGSITFMSTSSMQSLQDAYDNGNTIVTGTDPIDISGPQPMLLSNEEGLTILEPDASATRPFVNQYAEEGTSYIDTDVVHTWPRAAPVIPANAVSHIIARFVGYDVANINSFSTYLDIRFDATHASNEIKFTSTNHFGSDVVIEPVLNGSSIDFTLSEVVPVGETYRVSWTIAAFTMPR